MIRHELVRILKKFFYHKEKVDELLTDKSSIQIQKSQIVDFQEGISSKQIPASSSNIVDLNTYKELGFYYAKGDNDVSPYVIHCPNSDGSASSVPFSNNKSFFLLVEPWNTFNYVKQTLTYYNNNVTYRRICANGNWGSWVVEGTPTIATSGEINYNDEAYKKSGKYIVWSPQNFDKNAPTTNGGLLVVEQIPNGVNQTLYCYGTNRQIWYRTYYNPSNSWSVWIRIDGQNKSDTNHTHDYLSLTGGVVNGNITATKFIKNNTNDILLANGDTSPQSSFIASSHRIKTQVSSNPLKYKCKDLNDSDYTTTGFYFCNHNGEAQYIKNTPFSSDVNQEPPYTSNYSFWLMVEDWNAGDNSNYIKQTLTYYKTSSVNNIVTYTRYRNNNDDGTGWSSWVKNYAENTLTKQDIVALGIPAQDTTYNGDNSTITISGNTIKVKDGAFATHQDVEDYVENIIGDLDEWLSR